MTTAREAAEPRRVGAGRRLAAAVVDGLAVGAVTGVTLVAAGQAPAALMAPGTLVLLGAVAMFYRVLTEGGSLAATPGKRLLGLRVRPPAGGRLDFAVAALRGWPWWLTGAAAGIDPRLIPVGALLSVAALVPILLDDGERGLHDRMAGTVVVHDSQPGEQAQP